MTSGDSPQGTHARFQDTHWSAVFAARDGESPEAAAALESLCRGYWYPLYAYVRRRGHDQQDARDFTQAFFERLLEKEFLRAVDPGRGKFRTFLLIAMEHFLAKEWRRERAQKRGGGQTFVSLDDDTAEERFRLEPSHEETPEKLFERRWALTLLDRAMHRLDAECAAAGKIALFDAVKPLLGGERAARPHGELATQLGLTENALNIALSRLRRRYGELVREEIAQTVSRPEDVEQELRYLVGAIRV